jgi:hypothetical protein
MEHVSCGSLNFEQFSFLRIKKCFGLLLPGKQEMSLVLRVSHHVSSPIFNLMCDIEQDRVVTHASVPLSVGWAK